MAKYYGVIGFATQVEIEPGVVIDKLIERPYSGDIKSMYNKNDQGESLNRELNIRNIISIVADPHVYENVFAIRYITWMNSKWEVYSVEIKPPRMELSVGGLYRGEIPDVEYNK